MGASTPENCDKIAAFGYNLRWTGEPGTQDNRRVCRFRARAIQSQVSPTGH
jgi:hypothetical protein